MSWRLPILVSRGTSTVMIITAKQLMADCLWNGWLLRLCSTVFTQHSQMCKWLEQLAGVYCKNGNIHCTDVLRCGVDPKWKESHLLLEHLIMPLPLTLPPAPLLCVLLFSSYSSDGFTWRPFKTLLRCINFKTGLSLCFLIFPHVVILCSASDFFTSAVFSSRNQ